MLGSIDRLTDRVTDRVVRRVVLLALVGCLGLAAFGVALAALHYWLVLWMSQPAALLIVALLLTIAALGCARLAMGARSAKTTPGKTTLESAETDALAPSLVAAASDLAGEAVRADPLGAMLGAGAAGFILETRPDLDHALIQQVLRQFIARP
ncbi:MAG: phage holin family protein [Proteobacteria bacterium]|nr:phage holin family protein [Pseudomonadota bacterium]